MKKFSTTIVTVFLLLFLLPVAASASDLDRLREFVEQANADKASYAILIRHALAPGTGDPQEFTLGACETQRNLDETGRTQARQMGERLKQAGLSAVEFYSSQWCRCLETANLMREAWSVESVTEVRELPAINSFFERVERRESQTRELQQWLLQRSSDLNTDALAVLLTHQVNITALTDIFPASGEMVLLRLNSASTSQDRAIEVLGSIAN